MKEQIKYLIQRNNPNIDNVLLEYLINYFYIVIKDGLIPEDIDIGELIIDTSLKVNKLYFFTEEDSVYKYLGPEVKGLCDADSKILFISSKLEEPLKEMTIYHEIHHIVQTNKQTGEIGINQEVNKGRLIMEGQTQYVAEKIYSEIHNVEFEEKEYKTEQLRMLPGGIVRSNLHNYQLYDNLLTKLAIILNVSKDFFVAINYQNEFEKGLKNLEKKYEEARSKYDFPQSFDEMLYSLDYIYTVDYYVYKDNPYKQAIKNGIDTPEFEIHPNDKGDSLSLKLQKKMLNNFDVDFFTRLTNNGPAVDFYKYIVDNSIKESCESLLPQKKKDITTD